MEKRRFPTHDRGQDANEKARPEGRGGLWRGGNQRLPCVAVCQQEGMAQGASVFIAPMTMTMPMLVLAVMVLVAMVVFAVVFIPVVMVA